MPKQFTEKDAITNLQRYLRELSFSDESMPNIPVDGVFDSATEEGLKHFQRNNGLPVTGTADRKTWDTLYTAYLASINKYALPVPIILFPSYPVGFEIKPGDSNFIVSVIQYILQELSVIFDNFDAVKINGDYDSETQKAVKDFQGRSGLESSGNVDKNTWDALSQIFNVTQHISRQK